MEVKYRAWDGLVMHKNVGTHPHMIKSLVKPYGNGDADSDCEYELGAEGSLIVCQRFVHYKLMLYTGLKDKNNTEIYQGDFVRSANGFVSQIFFGHYKFDIKNEYGDIETIETIGFSWNEEEPFGICVGGGGSQYEVVGNIYENLKLIN